ncbi:MAG: stress response translation initiation inhibitor YciH [Deltaproteobacteria bacterium]
MGDLRKDKSKIPKDDYEVDESSLQLLIRRLTSGKGRTVIEIKGLPSNKNWCKGLAKDLKKKIGVGGSYKNDFIEIHGENFEQVAKFLESKKIVFKKIGG